MPLEIQWFNGIPKCYNCNRLGHLAKNCRSSLKPLSSQSAPAQSKSQHQWLPPRTQPWFYRNEETEYNGPLCTICNDVNQLKKRKPSRFSRGRRQNSKNSGQMEHQVQPLKLQRSVSSDCIFRKNSYSSQESDYHLSQVERSRSDPDGTQDLADTRDFKHLERYASLEELRPSKRPGIPNVQADSKGSRKQQTGFMFTRNRTHCIGVGSPRSCGMQMRQSATPQNSLAQSRWYRVFPPLGKTIITKLPHAY